MFHSPAGSRSFPVFSMHDCSATWRRRICRRALIEALEPRRLLSVDVLSYHGGDLASNGVNALETQLTPGNVNTPTFGENFTTTITDTPNLDGIPASTLNSSINYTAPDGQSYGEPIVKTGVNITTGAFQGVHDVVFVTNQLGSLFAIDANGGNLLWKDSFIYNAAGNPNPLNPAIANGNTAIPGGYGTETNSQDVSPWICIIGTPVIDPSTNSIFLITNTRFVAGGPTGDQADPHYLYTIHKVNLSNGVDTNSVFADTTLGYSNPSNPTYTYNTGPYVLGTGEGATTVSGQSRVYFNAVRQMVRPALEILNGRVYMASASHGDNQPYHGWILTFSTSTLAINGVFNTTPNGNEGGIWSGGDGVVFDSAGNFYVETGNGTFDGNFTTTNGVTTYTGLDANGFPVHANYGDTFLKLSLDSTTTPSSQNANGWGIKVLDYFSPFNNQSLNSADTDLGSGGPIILPPSADVAGGRTLIVGAGKEGKIYLLDTAQMGKFTATDSGVVQEVGSAINGTLSTPAYFNGRLYYSPGYGGDLASWPLTNGHIDTTSEQTSPDSIAFPGSSPYISANGTQNGIVWVIDKGTGQLRAYQASNLATELWTSNQNAPRDALPGGTVKFSVATPVNGRVYALSATSLVAYGPPIPPTSGPAAPTVLTAQGTGASTIQLNWQDNSNNEDGFSIERSSDGVTFAQIATVGVNATAYVDSNLNPESKYYYQVRAFNSFNTRTYSAYTNVASATTLTVGSQQPMDLYHFDADAGTVAADSIGTNTGTLVGSPLPAWVAPGRVGTSALSFTGNGQYNQTGESAVQLSTDLSPILGGTSSLEVWIKTTQAGNNTHWMAPAITGVEQSGGGNDINWGTLNAAGDIGIYVGDAGGVYSTKAVNDGQWHNIAMTRNATTGVVQLYIDGVLNGSGTFDTGVKTSQFKLIGALADVASDGVTLTGANYFNGQLDEVRIYNQVLDPDEIAALALPPNAPSGLTLTPASGTELDLSWTDNSAFATGYIVQRSVNNGPFASLPELPAGTTTYDDTGLTPNTLYAYQVEALDTAGASPFSSTASATTPVPPTTPTGATETLITTTEIDLKWTNTASNATGIRILRSVIGGEFVQIVNALPPSTTTYQDKGLTPGTEYDYHIQAYNIAGVSDFAGVHTGTIAAAPMMLSPTAGNAQVTLAWTPPAYNGDAQDLTFDIYRGTTSGGESAAPIATGVTSDTFTDTPLTNGQTYYYTVSAVDLGGQSVQSGEVSATPSAALPIGWTDADIGAPGKAGSAAFNAAAATWTVSGGGADIWNAADQFNFASSALSGDGSVIARVASLTNNTNPINAWAKAGVMIRNDTTAGSAFADVLITPGNGVAFQWRATAGGSPGNAQVTGIVPPEWVKLVRFGNSFSAYYSADGNTWHQVGSAQTLAIATAARAGLAVTAHNNAALSTATFTNVGIATTTSTLPTGWADSDIGSPALAGRGQYNAATSTWSTAGAGADIWNAADQFNFARTSVAGNATATALVSSITYSNIWSKAGVMFRNDATAGSVFADVLATAGSGVSFQWRATANGQCGSATITGVNAPTWVKLVRSGNSFTASYSTNGSTWIQIGTPQTITMGATALAGLAVTAHNTAGLNVATFTNVSIAANTGAIVRAPAGTSSSVARESGSSVLPALTASTTFVPAGGQDVSIGAADHQVPCPATSGGRNGWWILPETTLPKDLDIHLLDVHLLI